MKALNVVGLNSGTSMDGVDAAIFRLGPDSNRLQEEHRPAIKIEMGESLLHEFDSTFRQKMQQLVSSGTANLDEICRLNAALGEIFAVAAKAVIDKAGLKSDEIDLIGSHGQTIWHSPNPSNTWGMPTTSTLQLGEPAIIAARLKLPVIADFRVQDMAEGGQGAPLVSFADEVIFGPCGVATGVLNIGGIANITVIDAQGQAIMAFDTGPGNMLIDRISQRLFSCQYDQDGQLGAQGSVDNNWLSELLQHPYYRQSPPKTTGREIFGFQLADQIIAESAKRNIAAHDCLATVTALTAHSIAQAYGTFVAPRLRLNCLVLGGGGAENKTLVSMLESAWPDAVEIRRHEDFGISTRFKEALLFALLAYTTYHRIPNNVPACTGALRRVCLGKLVNP